MTQTREGYLSQDLLYATAGEARRVGGLLACTHKHRLLYELNSLSCAGPFLPAPTPHAGHEVVGVDGVEAAAWQLQRDSWLKFETTQQEPSAAGTGNRPRFIAAPTFEKRRSGYAFKTDTMGTGYYLDTKAIKVIFLDAKEPKFRPQIRKGSVLNESIEGPSALNLFQVSCVQNVKCRQFSRGSVPLGRGLK